MAYGGMKNSGIGRELEERGGMRYISLDEAAIVAGARTSDLLGLDDAISDLNKIDPRKT